MSSAGITLNQTNINEHANCFVVFGTKTFNREKQTMKRYSSKVVFSVPILDNDNLSKNHFSCTPDKDI